jgi:hypothetical protein
MWFRIARRIECIIPRIVFQMKSWSTLSNASGGNRRTEATLRALQGRSVKSRSIAVTLA